MDKQTKKVVILASLILIVLSTLPYLYGWAVKPADTIYLGNGLFNSHDNHVYYAYIEQVKSGRWLLNDVFTSEPHKAFLNIFWLIIGLIAKLFYLSPILVYHLAKIILIPLFVFTIFKFLNKAWEGDPQKTFKLPLALIVLFFTSGIGGWAILTKATHLYPLECWWPEAYAFLSIYSSPHFIASWILIIGSLYFYLSGIQNKNYKYTILGGLLGSILTQFHTFYLALLIPLTLIFLLSQYNKQNRYFFWHTALYNLFFLPVIIYYSFFLATDQIMLRRLVDNFMPTPRPEISIFFVFGFLFFLALAGCLIFLKKREQNIFQNFLLIWLLSVPFLLYCGLPFERRLIEGWQLPIVFFAVETLYLIYQKTKNKNDLIIIFGILLFSNTLFILVSTFTVFHQTEESRQFYLPKNVYQSLLWLKKEDPDYNKIVLASPLTGLPATFLADKTVFLAHGFETIDSKAKEKIWLNFINNNKDDTEKIQFLKTWEINYLIWGPYEKILNPQFKPEEKNYLNKIYGSNNVEIYQTTWLP